MSTIAKEFLNKFSSTEFPVLLEELKSTKLYSDEQMYNNLNGTQDKHFRFWFADYSVLNLKSDGSMALAYDADGHLVGMC